ncbi:MAG TPA: ribonuclease HII [Saprospiraceae bacterium]|nr:ribonuclease HII [Saprospiraceae bacterium]HMQ83126.1 ribonuclease HII [Saprospiraceae bacterium]
MLKSFFNNKLVEAGCDEAGRGCLAGPVFAAAVILPKDFNHPLLNDSKKLSEKKREQAKAIILKEALACALAQVSAEEIDAINILNASFLAMHRAISQLSLQPELLLIDGNRFNAYPGIPAHCIVKGDAQYTAIAAASILAKTARDEYMMKLDQDYPYYDWKHNKGYPTETHRQAVLTYGLSPQHRKTFQVRIVDQQGKLF